MDPSIISIMDQFDPRIAALLGWVVVIVKVLVDWLKSAAEMTGWRPPLLAFVSATALIGLLLLALGIPLTPQLGAQAVIAALITTILAMGATALQSKTQPSSVTVKAVADEIERRLRAQAEEMNPHG